MTLVKICGIMDPEDAFIAAQAGADFLGVVLWPGAGRFVSLERARAIAEAAQGVPVIGVFVSESAEEIRASVESLELDAVQLQGDGSRQAFAKLQSIERLYSIEVTPSGHYELPLVEAEWWHFDRSKEAPTPFNWKAFAVPCGRWMLAGGLTPDNVAEAVRLLEPTAVDVSGGVCGPDGLRKDPKKVRAFIDAVKGGF